MTLEEAIKHCLEEADNKEQAVYDLIAFGYSNSQEREDCQKCAEEHRQLAEWLRDYQRLLSKNSTKHELLKDGTLIVETDADLMTVNRILLSQRDTVWGVLFYPDENNDLINNYDTISRQGAIEAVCTEIMAITDYPLTMAYEIAEKAIECMPSAQPKGKWIHDKPNGFKCSKCNKYLDIGCGNMKMNFCPNCGADMREGEDG